MLQAVVNFDARARLTAVSECDLVSFFAVVEAHRFAIDLGGKGGGFDSRAIENEIGFDFHFLSSELPEIAQALREQSHADVHRDAMGEADQIKVPVADFVLADMWNSSSISVDDPGDDEGQIALKGFQAIQHASGSDVSAVADFRARFHAFGIWYWDDA